MKSISVVLIVLAISNLNCVIEAKKIVCYYGTWATYRHGNGQFNVNDIDPNLCTHLIYTFFGITWDATVRILDPYLDLSENYGRGNIEKFIALKKLNPNLKTMAAIGGWNEGSITFSAVASSYANRVKFAQNVVRFCKIYGFDGIDIDWEYPARRGGNVEVDKTNFVSMLKELRQELEKENLLLSAAVSSAEQPASISYDISGIARYLDFINIMAYDLHGPWDLRIDHNAPLYEGSTDVTPLQKQLNVNASINYWLDQGAPREKLILGIPMYGHTFTLRDSTQTTVGSFHSGPGIGGPYTNEAGMIGYNELCEKQLTNHWSRQWDSVAKVPYTFSGNQWISYDDVESIAFKVKFAIEEQLGGAMIWSIETDDFHGLCHNGKYPLLTTINTVLNGGVEIPTTTSPVTSPSTPVFTESTVTPTTNSKPITTVSTSTTPRTSTTTPRSTSTTLAPTTPSSTTSITSTPSTSTEPTPSPTSTTPNSTSTTPRSTSTSTPTTGAPPSSIDCKKDGYYRDPNNCSAFFICTNQLAYRFQCPSPLMYDESIRSCNWPSAVTC